MLEPALRVGRKIKIFLVKDIIGIFVFINLDEPTMFTNIQQ
jgi:hypothetical protein